LNLGTKNIYLRSIKQNVLKSACLVEKIAPR